MSQCCPYCTFHLHVGVAKKDTTSNSDWRMPRVCWRAVPNIKSPRAPVLWHATWRMPVRFSINIILVRYDTYRLRYSQNHESESNVKSIFALSIRIGMPVTLDWPQQLFASCTSMPSTCTRPWPRVLKGLCSAASTCMLCCTVQHPQTDYFVDCNSYTVLPILGRVPTFACMWLCTTV